MPSPTASPASSKSPTAALLSPSDRIARRALAPWAGDLAERLRGAPAAGLEPRALAGEVGAIANNTALIAAHLGRGELAWTLCTQQIEWHARRARATGDPGLNAYAAQPWVNLGRLEVLKGDWESAVSRFGALGEYARTGSLDVGCAKIAGGAWSAVSSTREEFEAYFEAVEVIDTLRALLLNRRWDEVLDFHARETGRRNATLAAVCDEAAVVARARLGDPLGAREMARDSERAASGWSRAAFRVRRTEASLAAGELDDARALLGQVAGVMVRLSPVALGDLNGLHVINRVASACAEAGLDADASAVAGAVLRGARIARDEVIEIEALRLLTSSPPDGEAEWHDELESVESSTLYARYRRGPDRDEPEIETLFDDLLDLLAG